MIGVLLLTVQAVVIVLAALVVVPSPVTNAITAATVPTGKGIYPIETATTGMEGTEGDAAGPLTEGGAHRLLTGGGQMTGTGMRGPLLWRMSKKTLTNVKGRGPLLRLPLTNTEYCPPFGSYFTL